MGLFSGLTDMFFGDTRGQIQGVSEDQLAVQREGLDYLMQINELPLEYRDMAMKQLMGFYAGSPEQQAQFVSDVQQSPFYNQMIESGREAVASQGGAAGLSRSGNLARDLASSDQNVLQSLVNQKLGGLTGFAQTPVSGANVANAYQNIGQTIGSSGMAQINAGQQQLGQLFGLGTSIAGLALSDSRLKDNVKPIATMNGHNLYSWTWNEKAHKLGLYGRGIGVMADEIEKTNPDAVSMLNGYKAVDYSKIGVWNG